MTGETSSAVIGVDLGGTKCHAVLADADGTILAEQYRRSDALPEPVDVLLGVLAELRCTAADAGLQVDGVAIGIPAFLDPRTGLVVGGFNLGWHGFDLSAHLDAAGTGRYVVENDVNLAALGEARVGAGVGASSFVTVSLGTGLGGAVVVDGTLIRGAHGAAGEFGFLMAGRQQVGQPGLMGMEALVGGRNLAARARELAAAEPASRSPRRRTPPPSSPPRPVATRSASRWWPNSSTTSPWPSWTSAPSWTPNWWCSTAASVGRSCRTCRGWRSWSAPRCSTHRGCASRRSPRRPPWPGGAPRRDAWPGRQVGRAGRRPARTRSRRRAAPR